MPIDKAEWEKGRVADTLETRIEDFLRKNSDKAFTLREIVGGIFSIRPDDWLAGISAYFATTSALNTLVKQGTVKAKTVKEQIGVDTYYTIG